MSTTVQNSTTSKSGFSLFSKNRINTGRQPELDLLKAIAVICMVAEHVYINLLWFPPDMPEDLFDILVSQGLCQLLNASLFMLSMGISVSYSRHNGAGALAFRGFALLSVGQLLILLRDVIPYLLGYAATGEMFFLNNSALVFSVDIMQLAGLSFLLLGLLKALKCNGKTVFLIACGLNILAWVLDGVQSDNYIINQLFGYFWSTDTESFFPLFNWFIFPAAGYALGEVYVRITDKAKFYKRATAVCLPIAAVYFVLRYSVDIPFLPDYRNERAVIYARIPDALALLLLDMAVLALCYLLCRNVKDGKLPAFLNHPAKHINKYYCISWVLIQSTAVTLIATTGCVFTEAWKAVLAVIVIMALCTVIIELYEHRLKSFFSGLSVPVKLSAFAAVWAASVVIAIVCFPKLTGYPNYLNGYLYDWLPLFN